jgi:hypothetical protein
MNYGLQDLKEAVERLDEAIEDLDAEDVDLCVKLIKNIASQIKSDFWSQHIENDSVIIQPVKKHNSDFNIINSLEFLYKPMHFINVYEGNEIEYYSRERTEELMESGAIDAHNDFWQHHETVYGNVYGSLPVELVNREAAGKLTRYGWKKTVVDIIEFKNECDEMAIREIAERKYRHYIIIREKETQGILVLRYNF